MIAITSIPSIAPPNRIASPLPIPEIIPPKIAHKNKSLPANGDIILTFTGNTSVINHANNEYTNTVYMAHIVNSFPCFFNPYKNNGMFNTIRKMESDRYFGVICDKIIDVPEIPLS